MITKNNFDAALIPHFREIVKNIYSKMSPVQQEFAETLKDKLSNPDVWQTRTCPVCGSSENTPLFEGTYNYGVQVVQCKACGFSYSLKVLTESHDKWTYETNESFYKIYLQLKKEPVYKKLEQTKAQYIIQAANQFVSQKGDFLDVGSAVGSVISAAQADGWDATGVEVNPLFLKESRSKGLNVIPGFFPDALSEQYHTQFQAISMLDVLEHMVDPVTFLESVKPFIASDGIILIQVPNLNSLYIQLDGKQNTNYCIGHWSYFTSETLNMTLEKAGFESLFLETYISEFDKIQQFSEADIRHKVQQLTGKGVQHIDELTIDWLHDNLLGYKIFGAYKLKS
ncbi:MAG: class I SAM-dependent methyltransferase [Thiotrichaceae bacterium]|nr:class I SAM-dependent methyltransferase [Thiotrichaceae bacterium]